MTSARIDPIQDLWVVVNDLGRLSLAGACHAYDDRLPIHIPIFTHESQAVKFAEQMNVTNGRCAYFVKKVVLSEVLPAADVVC